MSDSAPKVPVEGPAPPRAGPVAAGRPSGETGTADPFTSQVASLVGAGRRVLAVDPWRDEVPLQAVTASARRVRRIDPDATDLAGALGRERFDVILVGDALERCLDPVRLLEALREHVDPAGFFVLWVHNAVSAGALVALFARPAALAPPRRPFTRDALEQALARARLRIEMLRRDLFDPFADASARRVALPPRIIEAIRADEEALTSRILVKAVPAPSVAPPAAPEGRSTLLQALWDAEANADEVVRLRAIVEEYAALRQSLAFRIVSIIRRCVGALFPPGTARGRAYGRVVSRLKAAARARRETARREGEPGSEPTLLAPRRAARRAVRFLFPPASRRGRVYGRTMLGLKRRLRLAPPAAEEPAQRDDAKAAGALRAELSAFLAGDEVLSFPAADEPLVSILLVTYNKAAYTYACLRSILDHAAVPCEVIIVDNASTDETARLLDRLRNARVVGNRRNVHFLRGCNQGWALARGDFVLFLNNDALLTPGALPALVETLRREADVGAVGAKLVHPSGRLQEAGCVIAADGSAVGYGRGDDPDRPEYGYRRDVDYCSAACLLVRRALFPEAGAFDERYSPAYYEDADLCFEVWRRGLRVVYQPRAVAIHHEFTSSTPEGAAALCEANCAKFREKWKDVLDARAAAPRPLHRARDRRAGEGVLVLDDRVPTPDRGSGYPRMWRMLTTLVELGYRVTFIPMADVTRWEPETSRLQNLGVEVLYGARDLRADIAARRGAVSTLIVSRPHNAVRVLPWVREALPGARIIYDAEALFYRRAAMRAEVLGEGDAAAIERERAHELSLIRLADDVLAVCEGEREIIAQEAKGGPASHVYGFAHEGEPTPASFEERRDLLFVGGFLAADSPNEDAIVWFVRHVFPLVRRRLPDVRLVIAGANPPARVRALTSDAVLTVGRVARLRDYYGSHRLFVDPLRFGAGIPYKLTETMSFGLPSVVSAVSARGLRLRDGVEAMIASSPEEFSAKVVAAYEDRDLWLRLRSGSIDFVRRSCNPDAVKATLAAILKSRATGAST